MTFKALQMAQVRRAAAELDRAAWRSVFGALLRTVAAAAVSGALSFVGWQVWQWATASDAFALRTVHFSGLVHAREPDLFHRSGLRIGENLLLADLSRAARAIQADPWVASARLERRLPGEVVASIAEHRPAALVELGGLYVLDDEGRLFKRTTGSTFPSSPASRGRRGSTESPTCSSASSPRSTCSIPGRPRDSRSGRSRRSAWRTAAVSPSSRTTAAPCRRSASARATSR